MADNPKKTFSFIIAFWKQIGVVVVMFAGQWWTKTYSPEAWESVKPHFNELWLSLGGIVAAWDAASHAVANQVRALDAKKEGK